MSYYITCPVCNGSSEDPYSDVPDACPECDGAGVVEDTEEQDFDLDEEAA